MPDRVIILIFSRLDAIHEWTNRQTGTGQWLVPRLRIATRGKITKLLLFIRRWKSEAAAC